MTRAMQNCDKPMAAPGLISYRYRGPFGWIMIGAKNHSDAFREAGRSLSFNDTDNRPQLANLQMWGGEKYADIE
ncbi:hypothetical protein [Agrobacterium pusense]|uniref:hypothetical protein n=1 Tax=Agrobacterium pusense TaxID=648995 RepID=UPI0038503DFB